MRLKTGFALIISYGLVAETNSEYGNCGTNSCNQYISDRVCIEDTIGEDSQAPSDGFYRVGVLRSLSSGPGSDFTTMCAWEQALSDGLMSHVTDLDMLWIDSGSGISGGVQAGLCMRESGVNLAVGPSYSSVARGASIIGTIYEKNVIGATSTSPLLSDTDSYGYFSRVIPSDNYQGAMLAEYAVNTQGWMKIATLSISSEAYFEGITNVFAETAVSLGAQVTSYTLTSEYTESQISEALRKIRASGIRVVMIAMEPARDALVIANATGMLDEGWAWLTTELTITTLSSNLRNLPAEKLVDMEKLLHGFIGLVPWMDVEGQAHRDWFSCVDSHYDDTTGMFANLGAMLTAANGNSVEDGKSKAKDMWNGYYYDAMMLALRALDPLTASERANATRIREAIREMTYDGTSGAIALDAAGDRTVATYDIINIYNEAQNSVGTIDAGTRTVTTSQAEIFPGNTTTVPVDFVMACSNDDYDMTVSACSNSVRTVTLTQNSEDALRYCPDIEAFEASCDHASLKSAGVGLVMFGYAFIFIFLLALARVWSHKVIRLSQRKFLLIMIFGAFVALAGPLLSANQLSNVRCAALPCFTAVGYVLLFGPLFVKTWRVSVLVNNSRLRSKKVSNWRLYRRLAALIVVTVGLLAVMLLVDPPKPQTSSKPVDDADGNVHLVPFETCAVESGTLGMLVILLLGLMTAYGCFVSYQIRNVSSELSEARWIFLSVYNGALLSMVTLAVVLGLDLTYAELHLFASLGSVLTCMVTVSLIMVPKLINIYKDVKGATMAGTTSGPGATLNGGTSAASVANDNVSSVQPAVG